MSKLAVKVKNNTFNHEPPYLQDTNNITFIKNNIQGQNGDVPVNEEDIVIYTNYFLDKIDPKSKYNIALMIEGIEHDKKYYNYIEKNNDKFDIVLTWSKQLLDKGENYKQIMCGTTWLHDMYIRMWDKKKICSHVVSAKTQLAGHRLRHVIADNIQKDKLTVDIFGHIYNLLPFPKTKAFQKDHSARHITQGKIYALKEYMFSIVIENAKADYEFTEKLIDCFLSGTIPIYYGCPSIQKFFDIRGILQFDTEKECVDILHTLTPEMYNNMKVYAEHNYVIAQRYKIFDLCEDYILELCEHTHDNKNKNIIIYGDSHVSGFVSKTLIENGLQSRNGITAVRTPRYTCYNLNKKVLSIWNHIVEIEKKLGRKLNKQDIVFFNYGETDIRHHIGFQHEDDRNNDTNITNVITNYMELINILKKLDRFSIGICGTIPSQIYNGKGGNGRNSYKTHVERNVITEKFNNILKDECDKNNIPFIDIFNEIKNNDDGFLFVSPDGIHIHDNGNNKLFSLFDGLLSKYV
jgi:hypothetical protein|uniref:Fucosyltransferase C-terminal domain-containing protein n=1 Tax=viral metagenome TaxID=1070528 RepID=A0A6C0IJK4_9ZZZZ